MTTWHIVSPIVTSDTPQPQTVTRVSYEARLGERTLSGSVSLDPPGPSFTTYAELSQEQVLAWVWEKVSKEATEAKLQAMAGETPQEQLPWQS